MDIYQTNVLVGVVESLILPQSFLLDTFFPTEVRSDTEAIAFDNVAGVRRIAPFVSPLVPGKMVESRGFTTKTFTPAYVKDKRVFDPLKPLKRRAGERIGGGDISSAEREQANLQFEMDDQVQMLSRREELMAADAMLDGKVTIDGDGYDAVEVDFARDAALTVALAGGNRWGQAGILPTEDLQTWATLIIQKSGAVPTDIVFTTTAWKHFIADANVTAAIDNRRGGDSRIERGLEVKAGAQFKGVWGSYSLWLYNDWYVNDAESEVPILADGVVLMGGSGMAGVRYYGAIKDPVAGYQALRFFPKSWTMQDPAARLLMMQSAPLVAPTRPNGSFAATVI